MNIGQETSIAITKEDIQRLFLNTYNSEDAPVCTAWAPDYQPVVPNVQYTSVEPYTVVQICSEEFQSEVQDHFDRNDSTTTENPFSIFNF